MSTSPQVNHVEGGVGAGELRDRGCFALTFERAHSASGAVDHIANGVLDRSITFEM
jgi:hypothetical protein